MNIFNKFFQKMLDILSYCAYTIKAVAKQTVTWGLSSAGRASALQAEGHRFEPYRPHTHGGIAQLARAHGSYPWCRWFESNFRYERYGESYISFFLYHRIQKRSERMHRVYPSEARVRKRRGNCRLKATRLRRRILQSRILIHCSASFC